MHTGDYIVTKNFKWQLYQPHDGGEVEFKQGQLLRNKEVEEVNITPDGSTYVITLPEGKIQLPSFKELVVPYVEGETVFYPTGYRNQEDKSLLEDAPFAPDENDTLKDLKTKKMKLTASMIAIPALGAASGFLFASSAKQPIGVQYGFALIGAALVALPSFYLALPVAKSLNTEILNKTNKYV